MFFVYKLSADRLKSVVALDCFCDHKNTQKDAYMFRRTSEEVSETNALSSNERAQLKRTRPTQLSESVGYDGHGRILNGVGQVRVLPF